MATDAYAASLHRAVRVELEALAAYQAVDEKAVDEKAAAREALVMAAAATTAIAGRRFGPTAA